MKVLLTGANGFLGSHIAETLLEQGHEVLCLVRKTSDLRSIKGLNLKYYYGDITDTESLIEPVKECQAIIHNAGLVRAFDKETYMKANQEGTKNLIESVLEHNKNLKKFVYISSQAAMGPSSGLNPKKMGEKENPVSDYGISKLAGEKELEALNTKIPYTILRPSSVYGPRDKDILIFFQLINNHICPAPLRKSYFQLVFVKDIAKFAVNSILNDKTANNTYFLSDEKPYSLSDVGKTIAKATGLRTVTIPIPQFVFKLTAFFAEMVSLITGKPAVLNKQKIREMNHVYWLADNSKTVKDFNIGFTNLEIGAKITYSWYKENGWI